LAEIIFYEKIYGVGIFSLYFLFYGWRKMMRGQGIIRICRNINQAESEAREDHPSRSSLSLILISVHVDAISRRFQSDKITPSTLLFTYSPFNLTFPESNFMYAV